MRGCPREIKTQVRRTLYIFKANFVSKLQKFQIFLIRVLEPI
jgi:hypothetical protein